MMTWHKIRKPLLLSCLALSVALHAVVLYSLYYNPPAFVRNAKASKEKTLPEAMPLIQEELLVERIEDALEYSLNRIAIQQIGASHPLAAHPSDASQKQEQQQLTALPVAHSLLLAPLYDPEESIALSDAGWEDAIPQDPLYYTIETEPSVDLLSPYMPACLPASIFQEELQQEEPAPHYSMDTPTLIESPSALTAFSIEVGAALSLSKDADQKEIILPFQEISESTTDRWIVLNVVEQLREEWIRRSLAEATLPSLDYYGIEAPEDAHAWEEISSADVSYMQDPDSNRYIFSVTMRPDARLKKEKIPHHFYFFIDRSHGLEQQKFTRCKRAVQKALSALDENDTFSILLFDKRVVRFAEKSSPATPKSIQKAQEFLDKQEIKQEITSGPRFQNVHELLPTRLDPYAFHSVILISDGQQLINDNQQKTAFSDWVKYNQGVVNIYAAASGRGNNLALLDLISQSTGGHLFYSDTHAGFPRKLVKLVKELHDPLAKAVALEVVAKDSQANIEISGGKLPIPPLFANQPYTIVGTIDELCDFTLLIQGRAGDEHLYIKKNISLKDAQSAGRSLAKLWAASQTAGCYEKFLESGRSSYLQQARALVAPFDGIIAQDNAPPERN